MVPTSPLILMWIKTHICLICMNLSMHHLLVHINQDTGPQIRVDLTWSWVYFSTAAGVPGTGVGSRRLECLTPNPHASLFNGSMLPRLHIFMSALTHSGLFRSPSSSGARIVILVMEFMHEEERTTCPYHLKRLVRRAAVTSCTPNIAQSVGRHFVIISDSADPADHWSVVTENYFSCFSTKTYVVGTQKNRLDETVLLSTQNTCLN